MAADPLTPPVRAGDIVFGEIESDVLPFENAAFDFARVNEYLTKNPAVRQHVVPDALVSSCSECCMPEINGQPNVIGMLFRKSREGKGCHLCPVAMASERLPARTGDGSYLTDKSGRALSEADAVRMAEDGTA